MALTPVAEALARVLAQASPLPSEAVPLADAHGRVLASDLLARRTQPPDDVSAMDGYAARAADAPARLQVIGEVAAGHPFQGQVGPGQTARIFTGGVIPPGADTVIVQEDVERAGDFIQISATVSRAKHIRRAGIDFAAGTPLLMRGTRLTGRDLMLAAAMNYPELPVHRRPTVALLATGDELVVPGQNPGPGQIVYSNGYGIMALAKSEAADVVDLGIAQDRLEDIVEAIGRGRTLGANVLVTMGGASVGERDLMQKALAAAGIPLSFWKVALRPGRPLMYAHSAGMHILGLPGNPVSAFVCAVLFLAPLLRKLSGRSDVETGVEPARLGAPVRANDERADYLRARLAPAPDGGLPLATALPNQDSSLMSPLAAAHCLIVRAPFEPAGAAGETCRIVKLPL